MRRLSKEEKTLLREIASFYGCRVRFINTFGDAYWDNKDTIYVGFGKTLDDTLTLFFHELAHYQNSKTNRYPHYHNLKLFDQLRKRLPFGRFVRYCLDAEIFTENEGRVLLATWFPSISYRPFYRKTKASYYFLYGYYLRGN